MPSGVMEAVYEQLREVAGLYMAGRRGHVLQATALVHEAFVRLAKGGVDRWGDRSHFAAVAATVMRRVLVDELRREGRDKRGGGWERIELSVAEGAGEPEPGGASVLDLLALDEALEALARLSPRQARVVELRYFGGLTAAEVAGVLGVSPRTVEGEWAVARAWLRARLEDRA